MPCPVRGSRDITPSRSACSPTHANTLIALDIKHSPCQFLNLASAIRKCHNTTVNWARYPDMTCDLKSLSHIPYLYTLEKTLTLSGLNNLQKALRFQHYQ